MGEYLLFFFFLQKSIYLFIFLKKYCLWNENKKSPVYYYSYVPVFPPIPPNICLCSCINNYYAYRMVFYFFHSF